MNRQSTTANDISETELRILEEVAKNEETEADKRQKDIAEEASISQPHASNIVDSLESQNLLEKEKDGKINKLEVTKQGLLTLRRHSSGTINKPNRLLRLHKFQVKFEIKNTNELSKYSDGAWKTEVLQRDSESFNEQNNVASISTGEASVRISRNHVIVMVNEAFGDDPDKLVMETFNRCVKEAKSSIEMRPIEIADEADRISGEITNEHLAIMEDPLSKLADEVGDSDPYLAIKDQQDRKRFVIDKSKGINELEAGTHYGTHGLTIESINAIISHYARILSEDNASSRRPRRNRYGYGQ